MQENSTLGWDTRESASYPDVFPITFTHSEFPHDAPTMDRIEMPFGFNIQPFIAKGDSSHIRKLIPRNIDFGTNIARCSNCFAYINPYCTVSRSRWFCSLCGHKNTFMPNMTRYHRVANDTRQLPELQNILIDYPMLINDHHTSFDNNSSSSTAYYPSHHHHPPSNTPQSTHTPLALPTNNSNPIVADEFQLPTERPLVHVFLIQESMPLSSLDAAIEAVTHTIKNMHSDLQIILLTFSNRIGIYRLQSSTLKKPSVAIQYIQFASTSTSTCNIFDGHEAYDLGIAATSNESSEDRTSTSTMSDVATVVPVMPMHSVAHFRETAKCAADVRESCLSVLPSIYEAYSRMDYYNNNNEYNENVETIPKVMVGPAIEAIVNWVTYSPQEYQKYVPSPIITHKDITEHSIWSKSTNHLTSTSNKKSSTGNTGIFGLASDLANKFINFDFGLGSYLSSTLSDNNVPTSSNSHNINSTSTTTTAPIDSCCGVVLHVLLDDPQDLPTGSHKSVRPTPIPATYPTTTSGQPPDPVVTTTTTTSSHNHGSHGHRGGGVPTGNTNTGVAGGKLDYTWIQSIGEQCSRKGLSINIWLIAEKEDKDIGLSGWSKLAILTGGQVNRLVLGTELLTGKLWLSEKLHRAVNFQLALKCMIKFRASPAIDFSKIKYLGKYVEDADYSSILRVAACSSEDTLGVVLSYINDNSLAPVNKDKRIVIQVNDAIIAIAFAYDTMVETSDDISSPNIRSPVRIRLSTQPPPPPPLPPNTTSNVTSLYNPPVLPVPPGGGVPNPIIHDISSENTYFSDHDSNTESDEDDDDEEGITISFSALKVTNSKNDFPSTSTSGVTGGSNTPLLTTSTSMNPNNNSNNNNTNTTPVPPPTTTTVTITGDGRYADYVYETLGVLPQAIEAATSRSRTEHKMGPRLVMADQSKSTVKKSSTLILRGMYNRRKRLVAVRRLRILTVVLETTAAVPRILRNMDAGAVALLIIRKGLAEKWQYLLTGQEDDSNTGKSITSGGGYPTANGYLFVMSWAVTCVLTAAEAMKSHRQEAIQQKQALAGISIEEEIKRKKMKSPKDIRQEENEMWSNCISSVVTNFQMSKLLRLLFASLSVLDGKNTIQNDTIAQQQYWIWSLDCLNADGLLYPNLWALSDDLLLSQETIPLSRTAMMTATYSSRDANVASAFLVDSGNNMILYRSVSSFNHSSAPLPFPSHITQSPALSSSLSIAAHEIVDLETPIAMVEDDSNKSKPLITRPPTSSTQRSVAAYIRKRLLASNALLPRPYLSNAGTSSSWRLNDVLIEDGLLRNQKTFRNFLDDVINTASATVIRN